MRLPLIDGRHHLLLFLSLFTATSSHCAHAASILLVETKCPDVRRIVDRVHLHVCSHSSYADMKQLFHRTIHWISDVSKYLTQLMLRCGSCHHTGFP